MEASWLQELLETPVFSESEIAEMENLFRQVTKEALTQEFCQDLATSFSSSTCRIGKPTIIWQQVHRWFQDKQSDPSASTNTFMKRKAPESSMILKGGTASEISELAFEAKSSRDNAWYDVATFLNYRVLSTGDLLNNNKLEKARKYMIRLCFHGALAWASLFHKGICLIDEEVRVRFAGFGISHDEWANVQNRVRERSIPLEPSECHKIKVGDLVLCYQERPDYAVYVDAHVMEIQRMLHDIKGCRCIFVVRFDDDKIEEKIQLNKICCRPNKSLQ
ncbi:protein SAWADEE HOMEODOMAIN HOMOLOG 1 isoform X1 [Spinacia oleracea]|uniref:Protein SAWADEE HOMEODOMAIN HOMOLOG 1 isoform X1 n=1 Tax=Spinacia oleracea TaxID=3562 RepID=A0A9R0IQF3_SPIOL|nr:protein SAWADEE HOMEODOMAIN HOMOLOG 1 isoform X1 [Spinacia oleracea]